MNIMRWKGQFKKEWIMMRTNIFIYAMINLIVVIGGPFLLRKIFDGSTDFYDDTLIIGGLWLVAGLFIGVVVLLISLEKEMKQSYIWLHSPASMLELVLVKAVFAVFVTVILLIWCQLIMAGMFVYADMTLAVSYLEAFLTMINIIVVIVANSIYSMAVLFFFWAIYRVLHASTRTFGFVIAFGLYIIVAVLWEKLRGVGFFKVLANIEPIHLTTTIFSYDQTEIFTGLVSESVINSVGSVVFYSLLTVLLFWLGAQLFEKKVRL